MGVLTLFLFMNSFMTIAVVGASEKKSVLCRLVTCAEYSEVNVTQASQTIMFSSLKNNNEKICYFLCCKITGEFGSSETMHNATPIWNR